MADFGKVVKLFVGLIALLLWIAILTPFAPLHAQENQGNPENFTYTVQPGDTLTLIALRYNLKLAGIILANNLSNPNLIFPGQQIILPGVMLSPAPSTPPGASPPAVDQTHLVQPGETLFGIANLYGVSIGAMVLANDLANPDVLYVGQTLLIPSGPPPTPEPLQAPFVAVELSEPTIIQGRTLVIKVTLSEDAGLSGMFEGRPLFFSQAGNQQRWSIIAIHTLTEPNIYPITLTATRPDGAAVTTYENVTVAAGPYGTEDIQFDDERSELLDAELIELEQKKLVNLWSQVTPRPLWEGPFRYPVEVSSLRITSHYGTRRSYNGGPATSFHGGTDFGGGVGAPIYAAAAGRVVLAEPLTVRGNTVLIDHGMGLFSGYFHQNQLVVSQGQEVQAGALIGYMGSTGLVTGPHLHWEIRLQGIAVEPLQWIQQEIP
ncbi:MAG: LysM peptidoglycan-binding domain-containing M23 family metallopeptidase [Anaerolineae bacterium]|nr:LysM peptidoglycan-binding domain-containing M23 family metallopeptidase [Anaerolineae bacterium]